MSELTEFLLSRIAEDEAVAKAAAEGIPIHFSKPPGPAWEVNPGALEGAGVDGAEVELWDTESGYLVASEGAANHIARHDPARVLRECATRRRIVERCSKYDPSWHSDMELADVAEVMEDTLYDLAAIYADHPDFDPAWS